MMPPTRGQAVRLVAAASRASERCTVKSGSSPRDTGHLEVDSRQPRVTLQVRGYISKTVGPTGLRIVPLDSAEDFQ